MLWTVRHRAGKLSRFAFNCYRHEIRLLCRRPGEEALHLLSKEGVTQGDPLAMALYGVPLLPLAEILREEFPTVMQLWYADDADMMGTARPVAGCFKRLQKIGPDFGYYPEAEKSYFICPLADEAAAKTVFEELELEIQYSRGERYVGGFIGSTAMQDRWIEPKVQGWVEGVKSLARVATRYPQSAFAGFTQSLQSEWQYLSRCVPGVGVHLQPVEDAIRKHLIPALFQTTPDRVSDEMRLLLSHGVKQGGMNIRNPVAAADRLHEGSVEACAALVTSLTKDSRLDAQCHAQCVRQASTKARKERVDEEKVTVKVAMAAARPAEKRRLERIGRTGACWSLVPNKLNGTCMTKEEFFDNARLRYGWKPVDMCERCDGCNAPFTVEHALGCKKGGLVVQRHDDTRDEAGALAEMALTTSRVTYEPYIYHGRDVSATLRADEVQDAAVTADEEARGDVAIHGLWEKGKTCILDIRITDTDAKAHFAHSSEKVLEKAAKEKKKKYNDACLARRRTFCPLVYSVDGMTCKEALAFEKRIAGLLSKKMDRRYSEMVGFVRQRMCLAVVRSNTLLLRGDRVNRAWRPDIEDGAAFNAIRGLQEW